MPMALVPMCVPAAVESTPPTNSVRAPDCATLAPAATTASPLTYTSLLTVTPAGFVTTRCANREFVSPGNVKPRDCGALPAKYVEWLPFALKLSKQQPPVAKLPRRTNCPAVRSVSVRSPPLKKALPVTSTTPAGSFINRRPEPDVMSGPLTTSPCIPTVSAPLVVSCSVSVTTTTSANAVAAVTNVLPATPRHVAPAPRSSTRPVPVVQPPTDSRLPCTASTKLPTLIGRVSSLRSALVLLAAVSRGEFGVPLGM